MKPNNSILNPTLIRNYHFTRLHDSVLKVQFVGIGDKHRMMKEDDGSIVIIKEPEKGKPYRYGDPYDIDDAIQLLKEGHFITHKDIAQHIQNNASHA